MCNCEFVLVRLWDKVYILGSLNKLIVIYSEGINCFFLLEVFL